MNLNSYDHYNVQVGSGCYWHWMSMLLFFLFYCECCILRLCLFSNQMNTLIRYSNITLKQALPGKCQICPCSSWCIRFCSTSCYCSWLQWNCVYLIWWTRQCCLPHLINRDTWLSRLSIKRKIHDYVDFLSKEKYVTKLTFETRRDICYNIYLISFNDLHFLR